MRLSVILAAVLLLAAASCTTWVHVAESVAAFVASIDEQTAALCEAGWLPPKVCDYWGELRAQALEEWSKFKAEVIDYVIKLLSGMLTVPSAERPAVMVTIDHEAIWAAAKWVAADGYLTAAELAAIEDVIPK